MGHKRESSVLVIGVGNEYRSDDAVGLVVARRLAEMGMIGTTLLQQSGDAVGLLESWQNAELVILVDAVAAGGEAGAVYRIEGGMGAWENWGALDGLVGPSSHSLGVGAAIKLGQAIGQLPPRLVIYGIEGQSFEVKTGLSPAVAKAADKVVGRILEELKCTSTP